MGKCLHCDVVKDDTNCKRNARTQDGFRYFCMACEAVLGPEVKMRYYGREFEKRNRKRRNAKSRAYMRKRHKRDPNINKADKLKRYYGLSLDEWNDMFEAQNGCCAICGRHASQAYKGLCVDHDHSSGEVRELLCGHCNFVIGNAFDDISILEQAIEYLKKHNKS